MTLYEILGVTAEASPAEVKAAHRRAVKMHHPDVGGDPHKFEQAQRAYLILSDPNRRERYDRTGLEDDPTGPTEEQLARSAVSSLIMQFVGGNDDPNTTDLIAEIRKVLLKQRETHSQNCTRIDIRIKRVGVVRERLHHKDDSDETLSALLDERERDLNREQLKESAKILVIDQAARLLDGYSYRIDPNPVEEAQIWSALKA
jgi:curved DNA-binding protein CbpA